MAQRPDPIKDDPRKEKAPDIKKDAPTHVALSMNEIRKMVDDLGFKNKTTNFNGVEFINLEIQKGDRVWLINIALSKDGSKIWLTSPLSTLSPGQAIPPEIMRKMLETNFKVGSNRFAVHPNGTIVLEGALDNRNVSAEQLRNHINWLVQFTATHEPLWNPNMWPSTAPTPPSSGG